MRSFRRLQWHIRYQPKKERSRTPKEIRLIERVRAGSRRKSNILSRSLIVVIQRPQASSIVLQPRNWTRPLLRAQCIKRPQHGKNRVLPSDSTALRRKRVGELFVIRDFGFLESRLQDGFKHKPSQRTGLNAKK